MLRSEIVNKIMFDYDLYSESDILKLIADFPHKLLRWLAAHHPDNKTRKIFLMKSNIEIGDDTVINCNFLVSDNYKPLLKIGKRVAISPNVTIICASAPNNSFLTNNAYVKEKLILDKPVTIEDDVWIGANVVILPGVVIGKSAIIGAGAVVTKNVVLNSIYSGIPANKIKTIPKN